ncbi:unnamed protein product [Arabis nemorensis]|uniref:Uncharacterized protein n=1 Tax=Arabis nemorensis TaxID=586526 RepID=A0A565CK99_9BRAS|nr:unnamed protein product [Arabis nemorensis]
METPNSSSWSELPMDILISLLERLNFADFHRAKMACSNWYLCSKQTLLLKSGPPWLMLFPKDGCVLYNPDEDRVYKPKRDFSGIRFLPNSGKWFLVVDSRSQLCIIDVFSEKRIDLPPLESIKGGLYSLERLGDEEFKEELISCGYRVIQSAENLRGVLRVDEKMEEYIVVWCFNSIRSNSNYIGFCKNGEGHYREITAHMEELLGLSDMVLCGDRLYGT